VNGSGWIPADLTQVSAGSPVSALPVDPVNDVAQGYYYTYLSGSWELNAALESQKYQVELANDGGDDPGLLEVGTELVLAPPRSTSSSAVTVSSVNPSSGINSGSVSITTVSGQGFQSGATVKLTRSGQSDIIGSGFSVANGTTINGGSFNITGTATGTWNVVVTNTNNSSGTLSNGFTVNSPGPPPNVSSTSPSSRGQGAISQNITVSGSNFTNPATTTFSGTGVTVNNTTFVTSAQLTANITVGAGAATGTRNVTVTNSDGQQDVCAACFTVNSAPVVSSANPASSTQGTNGLLVTVSGQNFVSGASMTFSGTGVTVSSTAFVNATQLTATVNVGGSAPTGTRNITVTNPDGGVGTGSNLFTVNASSSPTQAMAQNDYQFYQNADSLTPGAVLATENTAPTITSTSSPIRLRMNVSIANQALATSTQSYKLQFSTATSSGWADVGASSSAAVWRFYDNPTPGNGVAIPSTLLTTSDVAESYEESNPSLLNPKAVAAGQEGEWDFPLDSTNASNNTTYYFRVVKSGGATLDGYTRYPQLAVNVAAPPPTVSGTSPSTGTQGVSGSVITVNGSNFQNGAAVSFSNSDVSITNTTFVNSAQIDVTVNIKESVASGPGVRDITVTNPDSQQGTCAGCFTVNYNPNLVGYWQFNEGSGGTTSDTSGNNNTGTLTNSPTWLTSGCQEGNCLGFNNSNNYVNIPHSASVDVDASPLTVSMWVYPTGTTNKTALRKQSQYAFFHNLGSSNYAFRDNATGAGSQATTTSYVSLNQWNHVAFVISGSTSGQVYINGALVPSAWTGTWSPNTTATNPLRIPDTTSYQGNIDAVRLYKAALTATQVQEIYQAGN